MRVSFLLPLAMGSLSAIGGAGAQSSGAKSFTIAVPDTVLQAFFGSLR
jgi:hypothetical protein